MGNLGVKAHTFCYVYSVLLLFPEPDLVLHRNGKERVLRNRVSAVSAPIQTEARMTNIFPHLGMCVSDEVTDNLAS